MSVLVLVAFVVSVLAYSRANRVDKELGQLRADIASGKYGANMTSLSSSAQSPSFPLQNSISSVPAPQTTTAPLANAKSSPPVASGPSIVEKFFQWLAVDWLMKLGAVLLFLGIGWIVSISVWDAIGEIGRVLVGIIIGAFILVSGHVRIVRYSNQGAVLEGLGAGVLFFTIFVAQESYHLFLPIAALTFLFLTAAFIAFSSVVSGSQALAVLGVVFGGISPLLAGSQQSDFIGLFSYIFVLSLGILWVVRLRGWRPLIFASFLMYALYSFPYLLMPDSKVTLLQGMSVAVIFATLFFVTNIWAAIKSETMHRADILTATTNAMLLIGWINAFIPDSWKGLVTAACAVVFSLGAVLVFRLRGNAVPVLLYTAVAGMMFGVATAFEFSGSILLIALTLEIGAMIAAVMAFTGKQDDARGMMYLFGIPIALSFMSMTRYEMGHDVFTKDFFALMLLGGVLMLIARLFMRLEESRFTYGLFTIVGALYFLSLIWSTLGNVFYQSPDTAVIVSLIIYTFIGLALYVLGKTGGDRGKTFFGVAILLFVVGHLLFVSVWEMKIIGRIITFSLVGILLMSTALISKKAGHNQVSK